MVSWFHAACLDLSAESEPVLQLGDSFDPIGGTHAMGLIVGGIGLMVFTVLVARDGEHE
jgi:hypothetical protein